MIIDRFKIDVMVLGNTHIRRFEKYKDSVIVNPGSISVPKGDGIPSFAYYEAGYIVFVNLNNGEIIEKNKIWMGVSYGLKRGIKKGKGKSKWQL